MTLTILDLRTGLPPDFERLRKSATAEGYLFLDRLAARWRDGAYMGDDKADLLAAIADGQTLAIGAQTFDEYDPHPTHRRIRHFYVKPEARRHGVGRALADGLTARAFDVAPRLHLRATHALSNAFWDSMGFTRVAREDRSHEKVRA